MNRIFFYCKELYAYTFNYLTPSNLSYFWNFGSLALCFLIAQMITGIILSWYYISHVEYAFVSVEYIMREVNSGWLIRYMHANGASFFFFVVYMHIGRAFIYGSYQHPRILVWASGLVIFITMILIAFLGYVLPWGQMSFWAATVITSLITVVPFVGNDMVMLIWGGFGIGQQTLTRFYSFHFLLPFILCLFILFHLLVLHKTGSSNPLLNTRFLEDKISFYPYYVYKDLLGILFIFFIYFFFIFFSPNFLGHPLNYIPANPGVTPPHIVPEWYFLPFYGILRAIPSKIIGVIAMLCSLFVLLLLPVLSIFFIKNTSFRPFYQVLVWVFFLHFILLGWLGSEVLEYPYLELSQILTIDYFVWFIVFLLVNMFEQQIFKVNRITL